MQRFMKAFLFSTLTFLLSSNQLIASETVRLTNGEWPPYLSKELKHYGLASHIISEAFKKSGVTVEWGFFPWKRAFKNAEEGSWDGSAIWSKNAERENSFLYSDTVIEAKGSFFHLKSLDFSWETYDDLSNYTIGAATGYFYGKDFEDAEKAGKIKVKRITKDSTNFKKLITNRVDLVVVENDVGYEIMNNIFTPEEAATITSAEKGYRYSTYHLIISKKIKNAQEIINAFNRGLEALRSSGELATMIENSQKGLYKKR